MKKFITIAICGLMSLSAFGQELKSNKVEQIGYAPKLDKAYSDELTETQLKARQDYKLGYSLIGRHNFKEAIPYLKKAIEIDTTGNCGSRKNGMAYSEIGYAYTRLGEFDNALPYLTKAIELNKYIPEPYLSLAIIQMQRGDKKKAEETLTTSIENIPNYAMSYVQRGYLYNSDKKYKLALNDFKSYLELIDKQNHQQQTQPLTLDIKKQVKELEAKLNK